MARRLSAKARRAALRNLRKARAALRKKHGRARRVRVTRRRSTARRTVRRTPRKTAAQLHRIRVRAGRKGARMRKVRQEVRSVSDDDWMAAVHGNPFRKGKVRKTSRRLGTIFKRRGRRYIVTRLRNGVKVARPWANRRRK